jgi:hypothetical protein
MEELILKVPSEDMRDEMKRVIQEPPQYGFGIYDHFVCFMDINNVRIKLQGAVKLSKVIQANQIKHVKLPKLYWFGDILFAERIYSRNSPVTLKEVEELELVFRESGFSDVSADNLIAGTDGVYIVDTGDSFDNRISMTNFYRRSFLKRNPGFTEDAANYCLKGM